jgi:hypothetical protein
MLCTTDLKTNWKIFLWHLCLICDRVETLARQWRALCGRIYSECWNGRFVEGKVWTFSVLFRYFLEAIEYKDLNISINVANRLPDIWNRHSCLQIRKNRNLSWEYKTLNSPIFRLLEAVRFFRFLLQWWHFLDRLAHIYVSAW